MRAPRLLTAGMACLALLAAGPGLGHPEDEFCVPGETALDPELCAALEALDSSGKGAPELPTPTDATGERGFAANAGLYVRIGIGHILPGGLDHILFVLALFLSSRTLRALLWQISAFTLAHTATLGLAAAGVIAPPAVIVEPLIAASIAVVAVESLLFRARIPRWRVLVVFLFGLVHGLGFAGFFGELDLPSGQFWSALIGFNIGVEIGQLGVIAAAAVLAAVLRKRVAAIHEPGGWRHHVVVPASLAIAFTGTFWAVQRLAEVLSAG